ncbi:MAG: hypothetical protein IBGAMO2_400002 [Arenicellales bacterium IbO2]|nr:MAG: hypothetical protein IBGAMO2_400002 [Arenicellales bacterium IbO2]
MAEQYPEFRAEITEFVYSGRGGAYGELGNHEKALMDYNKGLELNPNDVDLYCFRGETYIKLNEHEKAFSDFEKVLKSRPDSVEAIAGRGAVYYKRGEYDDASSEYERAIELSPYDAELYNSRGLVRNALSLHRLASKDFEKALELNSKFTEAKLNLGESKLLQEHQRDLKRIRQKHEKFLSIAEYEARQKEFQDKAKEVRGKTEKWLGILRWIAGGFLVLVLLCMGYTFKEGPKIWPIFPLITAAAGLCAFPFIWQIRTLKQEEARLMALSQDAYTKGTLANLINVNLGEENQKELLHKFFDHHAEHGTAQLIVDLENNGKSESGAVNVLIKYLKDNMSGNN